MWTLSYGLAFISTILMSSPLRSAADGPNSTINSGGQIPVACQGAIAATAYNTNITLTCFTNPSAEPKICSLLIKAYAAELSSATTPASELAIFSAKNEILNKILSMVLNAQYFSGQSPGEIAWITSQIQAQWAKLPSTTESVWNAWAKTFNEFAEGLISRASDWDIFAKRRAYMRASTYFFLGYYPYPTGSSQQLMIRRQLEVFKEAMDLWSDLYVTSFYEVPFDNGTATCQIKMFLVVPKLAKKRPPLIILTQSEDISKEFHFPTFGLGALERGYAVLYYDGPGQNEVIIQDSHMPLYLHWGQVFETLLRFVKSTRSINSQVNTTQIVADSISLGGFLLGKALSESRYVRKHIKVAVINPPIDNFQAGTLIALYAPYAALSNVSSSFPGILPPGIEKLYSDPVKNIIEPLFKLCSPESPAGTVFAALLTLQTTGQPLAPVAADVSYKWMGNLNPDPASILKTTRAAVNKQSKFIIPSEDVAKIDVPLLLLQGALDVVITPPQGASFFSQLNPKTQAMSLLYEFSADTGAAEHAQQGNVEVHNAIKYGFLSKYVQFGY